MKKQLKGLIATVEVIVIVVTLFTGITIVNTTETFAEKSVISDEKFISKYDEVNMFTSDWNSYFGVNNGWFEGAEGEIISQSNTSWTVEMDTIGWGGIWGAQIYQGGTLSIQKGLEYTLKCSLLSEDCDKAVFIGIRSVDTYAYGKWIKLESGVATQIDETFTALADADSIYIGLGGEFGDREDIDADGSIRYSFAEGGILNYLDENSNAGTKIECKNMLLGLTSEIDAIDHEETTADNSEIIQPTQPSTEQPTTTKPIETQQNSGNATQTVTTATKEKVSVKSTKVKSATKKKSAKKAKISLKKVKGVTGYQIKISTTKKFTKKQTITKNFNKNEFTINKLKANKKYFVKARCYKVVKGRKYYGEWTKVKQVKIK